MSSNPWYLPVPDRVLGFCLIITAALLAPSVLPVAINDPEPSATRLAPVQSTGNEAATIKNGLQRYPFAQVTYGTNPYYSGYNPYYSGYNPYYGAYPSPYTRPYYGTPYYGLPGYHAGAYGFGWHPAYNRPLYCYSFGVGGGFSYVRCW